MPPRDGSVEPPGQGGVTGERCATADSGGGVPGGGGSSSGAVQVTVALKKYYLQCACGVPLDTLSDVDREWADSACMQFETEATIISSLSHPNIIKCLGVRLAWPPVNM
jgi:hypothetical protein